MIDVIVCAAFAFFFANNRREHLRLWAIAFGIASIRQALALAGVLHEPLEIFQVGVRLGVVAAGVALMQGTYEFLGRRLPRPWYIGAALVGVWAIVSPFLSVSFMVATIPVFFFRAATDLVTGITILRRRAGVGALFAGGAFVVWGLHRANYPMLRPLEWAAPWGFELATVLGIVVAIGVITMHYEQLNEELAKSEAQYRLMFESALDGYISTDPSGNILSANPAVVQMLGYDSAEELRSMNMADIYASPDAREPMIQSYEDSGVVAGEEIRWRRKDGEVITVKLRGQRVWRTPDEPVFEGSVRDITDEKAIREQLDLARRMEALGRLAGGIAHDFSNVLTAILAGIDLAEQELTDGTKPTAELEAMRRSAEQGADLSQRLLSFSRPDIRGKTPTPIDEALDGASTMLRRLIPENIRLETTMDAPDAHVMAEPGQLERVVTNLAINAQSAITDGGTITIDTSATSDGEHVVLTVSDDGKGMDDATIERIFEPFYTTGELGKATGLGLATVFTIVQNMEGSIEVESEPDIGTTFRLTLPTCPSNPPDGADEPREAQPTPTTGRKPLVLLAEDEPLVRKIVKRTLERGGYRTLVASDGEDASRLLEEHIDELDIVVTDVVMPRMSGPELLDIALERRPDLPFLLLSGYTADKVGDRDITRDHFLEKPFTRAELLGKIDTLRGEASVEEE